MKTVSIDEEVFNDIYYSFKDAQQRFQIFFGGSSSGKSYFLAQRTALDLLGGKRNYLVIRNTYNTVRNSVYNEICKIIQLFQLTPLFKINKSEMTITCTANNRQILFAGLDDPEKLKSITPINGVITDVWIEEATETSYQAMKHLDKRLRGESKAPKRITMSFNPVYKDHWIYKQFFGKWEDNKNLYQDEDLLILKTTYKDNRFLELDDIKALENESDSYFYQVYTLGNWGILGNVIFKNWRVEDLEPMREIAVNTKNGLDFGYANDPAALTHTHYNRKRKTIYILDELYETGLTNDILAEKVKEIIGTELVVCDSEDPKSIAELSQYGISAIGARKGKGSVNHGIQWLQQQTLIINTPCQNTKNNLQRYKWKEDKNGVVLPVPVDRDNHIPDALRYAYEDERDGGDWKDYRKFNESDFLFTDYHKQGIGY